MDINDPGETWKDISGLEGQYFRGVLVDLEPESGYAYQVLELTGTEK